MNCNKLVIFSPVYKFCPTGNICISKTVCCSVSCKPVSTLINSDSVKSFVMCKIVCFSNDSMAKEFNSVNYSLVTCTEHPMNVFSSIVKISFVSYRTTCPVDFDIVEKTINVTLLSTYHCFLQNFSSHFSHCNFHFGTSTTFSKATYNTLSLLITIISLITTFPINTPILKNTILIPSSLLLPPRPSASLSQSALSLSPSSSSSASSPQSPPPTSSTLTPSLLQLSVTLPSLPLSPSPVRKSVSCNYCCQYNSISLQTALMIFITSLCNVILNFQSTKMILGFNIFAIFIRIDLCKILY